MNNFLRCMYKCNNKNILVNSIINVVDFIYTSYIYIVLCNIVLFIYLWMYDYNIVNNGIIECVYNFYLILEFFIFYI